MDTDEDPNSKQALKIAIRILRERCNAFQKRISILEDENKKLKSELQSYDKNDKSLSEMDSLKQRLACAEEQNGFLLHKMKIISQENLQLWSNLGKLTNANKSLGSHLNKINDSLSQHVSNHQPLIRSKTFTQERPTVNESPEKVINEEKLDLEDVSLKLMSNMNDVQNEIDSLSSLSEDFKNIGVVDNVITSSLGFKCDYDISEAKDFDEEINILLKELEYARDESQKQNKILREILQYLESLKENQALESKNKVDEAKKMCPVCSQQFPGEMAFITFVNHVESHFKSQDTGIYSGDF